MKLFTEQFAAGTDLFIGLWLLADDAVMSQPICLLLSWQW